MRISAETIQNLQVIPEGNKESSAVGMNALKNLLPHQTLLGEILDIKDGMVKVSIGEDAFFFAKADPGMSMSVGQNLVLELLSGGDDRITLRPLYQNLSHDVNLMKALSEASLPKTARNIEMTAMRLEEGMPIDKASLQLESHELFMRSDSPVRDIHMLLKMNMEVNEVNLSIMDTLHNNESYILQNAAEVPADLVKFLVMGNSEGILEESFEGTEPAGNPAPSEPMPPEVTLASADTLNNPAATQNHVDSLDSTATLNPFAPLSGTENPALSNDSAALDSTASEALQRLNEIADILEIKEEEFTLLKDAVKEGFKAYEKEPKTSEFKPEHFERAVRILHKIINDRFSFKAEGPLNKDSVTEYYEKVYKDSSRLLRTIQHTAMSEGQSESSGPASTALKNITDSLSFLHDMNQFVNFVALPLKLSERGGSGELYVMSKKGAKEVSDEYTAYLKLNMPNLGPLECGIRMNTDLMVTTNFVLESEEILDYIAGKLPMLDKRLEEKGYHLTAHTRLKSETDSADIFDEIRQCIGIKKSEFSVMNSYGFDVRA